MKPTITVAALGLALIANPALAYVGPGAGLSAIGSVLAFVGVIFLMIAGFFFYPVKRMIVKMRGGADTDTPDAADAK
ncbi:hypothetical protein [Maritimibacter dapengensis]|uniref:Uncharacterized protein n=1 Tax=Maritimibacter dapengensis TaxID=2836868 RepID=A0ABS6SYP7_9RHOB|nr:hypothetical protein [Maritimibacter dapengensis]MBV7378099.1 hypothetical protein [Maritimibacter dapengensis]